MTEKICPICGTKIPFEATKCFNCKSDVQDIKIEDYSEEEYFEEDCSCEYEEVEDKPAEFLPTLLFAYFLGGFGIHRFFTGHTILGVIQLLTLGGCGLWAFIDFILICFNKFTDEQGRPLRKYDKNLGIVFFVIGLVPILLIFLCLFIGIFVAFAAAASSM